jgi:hypothetical protein
MYWIALFVPFVMVVAGLIFSVTRRRSVTAVAVAADVRGAAELGRRRSSNRLRLGLLVIPMVGGVIAAAIIALYQDADGVDGPLGRTSFLLIAPLLVTIVTVLVLAFVPKDAETAARRAADLAPRSPWTFASGAALTTLLVMAIVLAAATTVFGLLAWPNGESLFYFYGGYFAGGGGPFPGFGFGVPILVTLVLLSAVVWLSFSRIARAPRPTDESLRAADAAVRRVTTETITAMASFAVTLTLAIVVLMASTAFWDVAREGLDRAGNPVPVNFTADLLAVLSHAGIGLAVGCLIVAIYFLVHAVSSATGAAYRVVTPEIVSA